MHECATVGPGACAPEDWRWRLVPTSNKASRGRANSTAQPPVHVCVIFTAVICPTKRLLPRVCVCVCTNAPKNWRKNTTACAHTRTYAVHVHDDDDDDGNVDVKRKRVMSVERTGAWWRWSIYTTTDYEWKHAQRKAMQFSCSQFYIVMCAHACEHNFFASYFHYKRRTHTYARARAHTRAAYCGNNPHLGRLDLAGGSAVCFVSV